MKQWCEVLWRNTVKDWSRRATSQTTLGPLHKSTPTIWRSFFALRADHYFRCYLQFKEPNDRREVCCTGDADTAAPLIWVCCSWSCPTAAGTQNTHISSPQYMQQQTTLEFPFLPFTESTVIRWLLFLSDLCVGKCHSLRLHQQSKCHPQFATEPSGTYGLDEVQILLEETAACSP